MDSVPADLRPVGDSDRTYVGRLQDGTMVAVKRVPSVSAEEAHRMLEYLRRLADYANPFLVPIRGAQYREGALWVISEFDDGLSLRDLMDRGSLTVSQVVAIGMGLLGGLSALQQVGLSHGDLHSGNVHVARDGRVRLGDYALRPRFRPGVSRVGWPDPKADLMAAGTLLCAALGLPLERGDEELSAVERSAPALAAALRVMSEGRGGRYAGSALGLFEEASGHRARPLHLERSREELGRLVRSEEPPLAAPAAGPTRAPVPSLFRPLPTRRGWWLAAAAAFGVMAALFLTLAAANSGFARRTALVRATPAAAPPQAAASPAPASTKALPNVQLPAPVADQAPPPAAAAGTPQQAQQAAPAPAAPAPPPAEAASAPDGGSPTGAVAQFYDAVVSHDFSRAVQLWTPSMQTAYPPGENIYGRFSNTTSMTLHRDQVVSTGAGSAVVSIDLVEVRGGQTYHWVGNWYLVQDSSGWLLDRPSLRPA